MRILVIVIITVFAAYSGWWFLGYYLRNSVVDDLLSQDINGWQLEGDFNLKGFPNRYDATFEGFSLSNADTDRAWRTDRFHLAQFSYRPNHVIALWPETQHLRTPNHEIDITGQDISASLVFQYALSVPLDRFVLQGNSFKIENARGWALHGDSAVLALRDTPDSSGEYDLDLEIKGTRFTGGFLKASDSAGTRRAQLDAVSARLGILYDRPLALRDEGHLSQLQRLDIDELHIAGGDSTMQAQGQLKFDAQGYPTGEVELHIEGWKNIFALVKDAQLLPPQFTATLDSALKIITLFSGQSDKLSVPLQFHSRKIYLRGIPLGKAPALNIKLF